MKRRIRVVLVGEAWPAQGGIPTFAETVARDRELNAMFDLTLVNTARRAVRVGGTLSLANLWHALADSVRVFRAGRRADVVHVLTALLPTPPLLRAWALCRAAKLGGAVVLCHVHTGQVNVGAFETFVPSPLQRLFLRRFGFVHAVLAVSGPGAVGLESAMPGTRIEVVDNAVDVGRFQWAAPGKDDPGLLYVGTIAKRKGLFDLIEAVRLIQKRRGLRFHLEVIGSGNEAGEEEAEAASAAFRSAGLSHVLLGPRSHEEVRQRLAEASIFVLPSHTEGQPISLLEAMASGLPIVSTRVGAIPEMVRDGVDGLLANPGDPAGLADALERLISSPDERVRMGSSTRRRAEERYNLPRLRTRLAELYGSAARAARRN